MTETRTWYLHHPVRRHRISWRRSSQYVGRQKHNLARHGDLHDRLGAVAGNGLSPNPVFPLARCPICLSLDDVSREDDSLKVVHRDVESSTR